FNPAKILVNHPQFTPGYWHKRIHEIFNRGGLSPEEAGRLTFSEAMALAKEYGVQAGYLAAEGFGDGRYLRQVLTQMEAIDEKAIITAAGHVQEIYEKAGVIHAPAIRDKAEAAYRKDITQRPDRLTLAQRTNELIKIATGYDLAELSL